MTPRDELIAAKRETTKLALLVDRLHTNLRGIANGIHRDKTRNLCWLHGDGGSVFLVEDCLKMIEEYIEGK